MGAKFLKTCEKKRDVKRGSQKMRSSALTLVTQCRVFSFFYFFLDSFSSQKKTWLGQKIGTKNMKWSALYKIHMFSV